MPVEGNTYTTAEKRGMALEKRTKIKKEKEKIERN